MPFLPGVQEHRIWLVAEKKCLVAKKKDSSVTFAFAGEGGEDSSKVTAVERNSSESIGVHLVFKFGKEPGKEEKYFLCVKDDIVSGKQFFGEKPSKNDTYFVVDKIVGPFEALKLGSDDKNNNKRLAVNKEDKTLTIKESQETKPENITLVICDAGI